MKKILLVAISILSLTCNYSVSAERLKEEKGECQEGKEKHLNPSQLLGRLRHDIDSLFYSHDTPSANEPFFNSDMLYRMGVPDGVDNGWIPAIDIRHKEDELIITVDVPGVDIKKLDVSTVDGVLVIKGEREYEAGVTEKDYRRMERSYGTFYRSITLPSGVNTDKIKAKVKGGVLEIRVPRTESSVTRKITVEE